MEVTKLERNETNVVTITLHLPKEEWEPYLRAASLNLQKQSAVKGFRAGKAPLGAAIKQYGRTLFEQAASNALPEALGMACVQYELDPVSQPAFTRVDTTAESVTATCKFVAYPQVSDLPYKGVPIEKPVKRCSEADIDDAIEKYRAQRLNVHPVERAAQMDDIVEVAFTGTHNGGPFPYDHNDRSRFRLGSGQLFAGLDEALVGKTAGEEMDITLTMPEDFHRDDIQGMTLDLHVCLLGVWARDLEECTDAFVQKHEKDCQTVTDLREKLRKQIQTRYDNECERLFQQNVSAAIAALVTCPLPEPMVQIALDGILNSVAAMAAQNQMTLEQLLESECRTLDEYTKQCRPIAEDKVRRSVALDYVIRTEKLAVTEDEYRKYMADYSNPEQVEKQAGGRDEIVMEILNDRARKLIVDNAVLTEVLLPENAE